MRLLLLSDMHLRPSGPKSLIADQSDAVAWMARTRSALNGILEVVADEAISMVICSGDVFHTPFPRGPLISTVSAFLRQLKATIPEERRPHSDGQAVAPFGFVLGNHDVPNARLETWAERSLLGVFHALDAVWKIPASPTRLSVPAETSPDADAGFVIAGFDWASLAQEEFLYHQKPSGLDLAVVHARLTPHGQKMGPLDGHGDARAVNLPFDTGFVHVGDVHEEVLLTDLNGACWINPGPLYPTARDQSQFGRAAILDTLTGEVEMIDLLESHEYDLRWIDRDAAEEMLTGDMRLGMARIAAALAEARAASEAVSFAEHICAVASEIDAPADAQTALTARIQALVQEQESK